jgi:crossover junction endodeoxyribonuclease RuvC
MIILGIDPGTATTGWGLIKSNNPHDLNLIDFGIITTKPKQPLANRIEQIYDQLIALISQNSPNTIAVENLFFNTNAKTAMLVGQARGAILLAGRKSNSYPHKQISIQEYTPLQVKIAVTGYGRADKHQIQQMVKTLLKLKEVPKPDDAADALAVAITSALFFPLPNPVLSLSKE